MKEPPPTIISLLKNNTPWKEFYWGASLPHWQPKDAVLFITSRLNGSLPQSAIQNIRQQTSYEISLLKEQKLDEQEIKAILRQKQELYFGKYDKLLDTPTCGPTWLAEKNIAKIVEDSLHWGDTNGRYKLICYTIMSNHIHWIAYKFDRKLFRVLQSMKRHTARQSNILLQRTGNQFWQYENYDRWMRDKNELIQKIIYVLQNPVAAGLVDSWKEWPFSWMRPEFYHLLPEEMR